MFASIKNFGGTMAKEITWLHLSDFHVGNLHTKNKIHKVLSMLRNDKDKLCKDDFKKLAFIVISGDIAYSGLSKEYKEFKSEILNKLDKIIGRNIPIFFVPGNHDLKFPNSDSGLEFLTEYNNGRNESAKKFREEAWNKRNPKAFNPIRAMFKHYLAFLSSIRGKYIYKRGISKKNMKLGKMPGDFSCTLNTKGFKLGFIGLNSTWRQFRKGDYLGKVSVDCHQLDYLFPNSFPNLSKNHANFLIQHHPEEWLDPEDNWRSLVAGEKNCDIVLCGHIHKSVSKVSSPGGIPAIKILTAKSLCGLEHYGKKKEKREYGYTIGKLTREGRTTSLTHKMRMHNSGKDFFSEDPEGEAGAERWIINRTQSDEMLASNNIVRRKEVANDTVPKEKKPKKQFQESEQEMKVGYVSIQYRLHLWLKKRDSKIPLLDRPHNFLVLAALEYVVEVLSQQSITTKDELFSQVLLSVPLEKYEKEVIEEVFKVIKEIFPTSIGLRSQLMSLIRDFIMQEHRLLLGDKVQQFYNEIFKRRSNKSQETQLALLCSGLAAGVAAQSGDEDERQALLDIIHEELSKHNTLLAYHIRGFAFNIANRNDEAIVQWKMVCLSAKQSSLSSDKNVAMVEWARREITDSAHINLKLLPFQLTLKREMRNVLVSNFNDVKIDGIGVGWGEDFVNWCMKPENKVIKVFDKTMIGLSNQQRERMQLSSLELEKITAMRNFNSYDKNCSFVKQVSRHNTHAKYLLGKMDEVATQKSNWIQFDVEQYKDCLANELWTPELVWLDMVVSDFISRN